MPIIDVCAQQPTERFISQAWLDTVPRWAGQDHRAAPSVESALAAMDSAGRPGYARLP